MPDRATDGHLKCTHEAIDRRMLRLQRLGVGWMIGSVWTSPQLASLLHAARFQAESHEACVSSSISN